MTNPILEITGPSKRGRDGFRPFPIWLAIPSLVAVVFLVLPITTLVLRTPWPKFLQILTSPAVYEALKLSLWTATLTTLIAIALGVPLAWWLGSADSHWHSPVRLLVTVPLVLPPVVGGAALLFTLGRNAPLGQFLFDTFGVSLPFSTTAVVLSQLFVGLPFLVISLEGAFRTSTGQLEEAAYTLGASPWTVFSRVTIPVIRPALLGGIALCWARAIGEFGATMTFAGSIRGSTQTLPVAINELMGFDLEAAMTASTIMILLALGVLFLLRGRWLSGR